MNRLGGSQSDIANLTAEDIDWGDCTMCYQRQKLAGLDETDVKPPILRIPDPTGQVCLSLGWLFNVQTGDFALASIRRLPDVAGAAVEILDYSASKKRESSLMAIYA